MTVHANDHVTAALDYAQRGWHVFPLRPGTKYPAVPDHRAADCDHADPRCRDGHTGWEQRATTDPDRIQRCWGRPGRQLPGIGIATGPSRLVVVDLDIPGPDDSDQRSGAEVFAVLADTAGAALPEPWTVATPSGGWHLYFQAPTPTPDDPGPVRNTTGRLAPHIDTRAAGGYVVAPPTTTPAGRYVTTRTTDPAPLPDWLLHRLRAVSRPPGTRQIPPTTPPHPGAGGGRPGGRAERFLTAAVNAEVARVVMAPIHHRNQTLFLASVALGQLVAAGALDRAHVEAALEAAAAGHVGIEDFTEGEMRATIASGLADGARKPRRLPAAVAAELGGAA